jgi:signal transduction histidine kinase/DNA-binding response OmpR family regulator
MNKAYKTVNFTIYLIIFIGLLISIILTYVVFNAVIYRTSYSLNNTVILKAKLIQERLRAVEYDLEVDGHVISNATSIDTSNIRKFSALEAQYQPAVLAKFILSRSSGINKPTELSVDNFYLAKSQANINLLDIKNLLINEFAESFIKNNNVGGIFYKNTVLRENDGIKRPILFVVKNIVLKNQLQAVTVIHVLDQIEIFKLLDKNTLGELKFLGFLYDKRFNDQAFDQDLGINILEVSTDNKNFHTVISEKDFLTEADKVTSQDFLKGKTAEIKSNNLIVRLTVNIISALNPIKIAAATFILSIIFTLLFAFLTYRGFVLQRIKEEEKTALKISQDRSQFFDILAHELRTPLNGILGMIEILLKTKLDPQQYHFATTVKQSGKLMNLIVDQTLTASRMDTLHLKLVQEPFRFNEILEQLLDSLGPLADLKKIQFEFELVNEMNGVIYLGDELRIRQVLINLLSNAIKYTNEGVVRISLSQKFENNYSADPMIRCDIVDTGIGIDNADRAVLFKKFSRLNKANFLDVSEGGLGLYISQKIIRLLGGNLDFVSQVNQGSHFYFSLPLKIQDTNKQENSTHQLLNQDVVFLSSPNNQDILDLKSVFEKYGAHVQILSQYTQIRKYFMGLVRKRHIPSLIIIHEDVDEHFGLGLFQNIQKLMNLELNSRVIYFYRSGSYQNRLKISVTGITQTHLTPAHPENLMAYCVSILTRNENTLPKNIIEPHVSQGSVFEGPFQILVADDNLINLEVISLMIQSLGHQVHLAKNGLEVLEILNTVSCDVIFMDINMPELNGIETTQKIRQTVSDFQQIPIIAMSANIGDKFVQLCLDHGMNDYLTKPVSIEILDSMIMETLSLAP